VKEGWLKVQGLFKVWLRRYVVLSPDRTISFYENEKDYQSKKKPKGIIQLEKCFIFKADSKTKKRFSFKIVYSNKDHETKFFMAASDEERISWMDSISKLVGISSEVSVSSVSSNLKDSDRDDDILNEWMVMSKEEKLVDENGSKEFSEKILAEIQKIPENVFSMMRLEHLFHIYYDPDGQETDEDYIGPDGIDRLCKDAGVDPENVSLLILAWHLRAKRMGYFTKTEFAEGLEKFKIDTIPKLSAKLKALEKEKMPLGQFKEMYKYTFSFAKDENQRSLEIELGVALLELLLKDRPEFAHTQKFCEFILKTCKAITMDQWMNYFLFATTVKEDCSNYSSADAWPVLFDEYVEWRQYDLFCIWNHIRLM